MTFSEDRMKKGKGSAGGKFVFGIVCKKCRRLLEETESGALRCPGCGGETPALPPALRGLHPPVRRKKGRE